MNAFVSFIAWSVRFKLLTVMCFTILATSKAKTSKEGSGIRPGLLTGPSKDTKAKEGESVEFRWRFQLSSSEMKQLQQIDFGYCYKEKLNRSLITIHKKEENNSTIYNSNVTKTFQERLQWFGGSDAVSFVLKNVTREDSNSYVMAMSFGKARLPILDHVELVVRYPPKILNKPVAMEQVRFPEGVSVQMSCNVDSCPRAQVTWYHDDRIVQKQKEIHDLTINQGHVKDSGVYRCEANNDLGSDFKQVLVIVTSCQHGNAADSEQDEQVEAGSHPDTLFTMIAPAVVFFVIFTAYFFFRCPASRNRRKRNRALVNSKATSTPCLQDDEQTTSLLADWSNFNDRGEKV